MEHCETNRKHEKNFINFCNGKCTKFQQIFVASSENTVWQFLLSPYKSALKSLDEIRLDMLSIFLQAFCGVPHPGFNKGYFCISKTNIYSYHSYKYSSNSIALYIFFFFAINITLKAFSALCDCYVDQVMHRVMFYCFVVIHHLIVLIRKVTRKRQHSCWIHQLMQMRRRTMTGTVITNTNQIKGKNKP